MREQAATMDRNWLGTLLLCGSDTVMFACLILAYLLLHGRGAGPGAATALSLGTTAVFSMCLWASSGTVLLAGRRLARDDRRQCLLWLLATVLLGTVFLVGTAREWANLFAQGITPGYNLFGTTYFTLTGMHGLHVVLGLIALLILAGCLRAGDLTARRRSGLEAVSVFWHFVDAVWVVIFLLVYLGAHL
jgi:heme/copper-type cytochrome/quinol oxidase subunit 3